MKNKVDDTVEFWASFYPHLTFGTKERNTYSPEINLAKQSPKIIEKIEKICRGGIQVIFLFH